MKSGVIADNDVFRFLADSADEKPEITHQLHIERLFAHIHLVKTEFGLNLTEDIKADFTRVFCIKEMHGINRPQRTDALKAFFMHIFKINEKYFLNFRLCLY